MVADGLQVDVHAPEAEGAAGRTGAAPTTAAAVSTSVVICAYTMRRWDDLRAAVASCASQTAPPAEVIVVIDHSDELLAAARRAFGPDVLVVPNDRSKGLAGARNTGVLLARGEIVAFLDDDAAADPEWLSRLVAAYDDPSVLGAGGAIEPAWDGDRPAWFPDEFAWVVGCTFPGYGDGPLRNLIGANMSYRRGVFEDVLFQEGVGQVGSSMMRCDDTDFGIRLRATAAAVRSDPSAAGVMAYVPGARVHHRVPDERSRLPYFVNRCFTEGQAKRRLVATYGQGTALGPERRHATATIPLGAAHGVLQSVRERSSAPLLRAGTSLGGLVAAVAGYGVESARLALGGARRRARPARRRAR